MEHQSSGSARQLERITTIDRVLRNHRWPTAQLLASELGVSERTVYRDIVFLRDRLGAPVAYDPRKRGYFYTNDHRFFPGVSLSPQEVLALMLAARVARPLLGDGFAERIRQAVEKILAAPGEAVALRRSGRDGRGLRAGDGAAGRPRRRRGEV